MRSELLVVIEKPDGSRRYVTFDDPRIAFVKAYNERMVSAGYRAHLDTFGQLPLEIVAPDGKEGGAE